MSLRPSCHAPSVSMYFDVRGNVIACCQNTTNVLGNVNQTPLLDIWNGEEARSMRATLEAGGYARGCDFCAWQARHADGGSLYPELYEPYRDRVGSDWPATLEFALSNRCNLECIMCNGDLSSTIRSRREHRPPLEVQYGDDFFEQLRPFLPHLRVARFLGGEPFLIPEHHRIWALMVEERSSVVCDVTTNGTVRTRRVEAVLDQLPFSIGVSVDGLTRETIEHVRRGADFDTIMTNLAWFRRYCARAGTGFGLTYCLMVPNHHELADFLAFADELDVLVSVHTVVYPPHLSLYRLPTADLGLVVSAMEAQESTAGGLGRNRPVWEAELARLRHWARTGGGEEAFFERWQQPADAATAVEIGSR
jgi:MoaA/NifB/PqqE/SkfB family radical SAM enzyme